MLRGFATINYWTDDIEAAKRWYAELLAVEPYFERPGPDGRLAYVEFRIGDYQAELGWSIAAGHRPVRRRGRVGRSCTGTSRMSPRRSKSCWRWALRNTSRSRLARKDS